MPKVITSKTNLDFTVSDLAEMPAAERILVVEPTHFAVEYVINPHMKGNIGEVDKGAAQKEWEELKKAYEKENLNVDAIPGQENLPDMVFCANQSLPNITSDGKKQVLMSIMHAPQRKSEVPFIEKYYADLGYEIFHLNNEKVDDFEGMGDAIWHYKKRLIWGGYGFRSSTEAYDVISKTFNTPVILLELHDPKFYHLDTCFCVLNEDTVLIYPKAFTDEGRELINEFFPNVIEANKHEAEELFACNAVSVHGKKVFIQKGCVDTNAKLKAAGFEVEEFSTDEYLKSGGSVFCMKMFVW